ncbi:mercury transporter (plasmid) [Bradyrhizobium sp. SK17]|jgi:copper chaperone CopZ|uniref:heavy-metal-associated domain-containing protein n=1 Tax=Bradyrhizobium sp. SK17 TaxID=2057741 RepID=UPI000C30A7FF|nr:heavy-metal-associated domain-containing protein [Bradyrhizobium sp. SK17]AUD00088.1 mercury transporter [Bradyrhizobium sp. SK17]AUD00309.1 mercury transporter [Bradyrhizobium sp. SK17]MBN8936571.1 mercury transporter [Hyphomicrobiales bacterium]
MFHRLASAVLTIGLFAAPSLAVAAESTVTLAVHHAGCVLCGPIVKSTLEHVTGVKSVQVSQADGMDDVTATVLFDNALTSPNAMIKATTDHGYPADLKS